MTEDEYLAWLVRHEEVNRWGLTWNILAIVIAVVNIVLLFTQEVGAGNFILVGLSFASILMMRYHYRLHVALHRELGDNEE